MRAAGGCPHNSLGSVMTETRTPGSIPAEALQLATRIASRFDLPSPVEAFDFPGKGNINQQTYRIQAGSRAGAPTYLLQLLNPNVFKKPRAVMDVMVACIRAQEAAAACGALPADQEWESVRLIPTKQGYPYLEIVEGTELHCWRLMEYIPGTHSYKSLREITEARRRLEVAEEAGRGLALFGALTARMQSDGIECPLPGYRDTALYYDQFHSILAGHRTAEEASGCMPEDGELRQSTEAHFLVRTESGEYHRRLQDPQVAPLIELALKQKSYALTLARGLAAGNLQRVVIHGDTKLENFLFSTRTGKAKALVDLDTIMPHTWLSDWGDMVRSLGNIAGEREPDAANIRMDLEVFTAAARGYLAASHPGVRREMDLMVDAPQIMALELGVRFLTDYLRGDSYFALGPQDPPDLNKIRARAQFRLFEHMRENAAQMRRRIAAYMPPAA